jgi:hypothetical protein
MSASRPLGATFGIEGFASLSQERSVDPEVNQ